MKPISSLRNRSVMNHDFSRVPHADIPRSVFKRSHGYKTTFNSGKIYPIYTDEVLPGDTVKLRLSSIARLSTPIVPYMDNLHMDFFFFFVPNRLVWDNWQRFMGEQDNPGDSTDYLIPQVESGPTGFLRQCLFDYMGIPPAIPNIKVNALHSRAYNLIYNEWFRDQNLQQALVVDKDDGPDDPTDYVCVKRGKRHDYFTSCLPWPQKGDSVDLPLGDSAPVVANYGTPAINNLVRYASTDAVASNQGLGTDPGGNLTAAGIAYIDPNGKWEADLTNATAASINSLREAFQLQRMLERDARGGTRYTEILRSHFRVESPDARLQRPEYLGGGSTKINISPIPQTESSDASTPQGNLAAIGFHAQNHIGFTKSFVEHGVVLGLVNVRADLTYQQGLNRMWSRRTKYDFYWPALSHLGENAVLNQEIWIQDGTTDTGSTGTVDNERVFGYQEAWAEYRYYPSLITGSLRSDHPTSLDVWHLSQDFATLPALNADFIEENPPVDRVVAVTTEDQIIYDSYVELTTTRPMPVYSVPGLIDHF